ncbi:hypothetical protein [Planctomycetes bacterium K23_9]|uniref:Uncharacterized protein n=1 Tax=Stieleria marina TaxID=1930275 RepID=A0A517P2U2_9BACT|nr:hypothetical protein K239x_57190 [Planctomycetes bacterium K23_9]
MHEKMEHISHLKSIVSVSVNASVMFSSSLLLALPDAVATTDSTIARRMTENDHLGDGHFNIVPASVSDAFG